MQISYLWLSKDLAMLDSLAPEVATFNIDSGLGTR